MICNSGRLFCAVWLPVHRLRLRPEAGGRRAYVPVSYPDSIDEVTNGLALCRLHHGATTTVCLGFVPTTA